MHAHHQARQSDDHLKSEPEFETK